MNMSDAKATAIAHDIRDAIASIHWCCDGPLSQLGGGWSPMLGAASREQYARQLYQNIDDYLREVAALLEDAADGIEDADETYGPGPVCLGTYTSQPIPPSGRRTIKNPKVILSWIPAQKKDKE